MSQPDQAADAATATSADRGFQYTAADNLVEILDRIGGSLLISTYQAGRLIAVGVGEGRLHGSLHTFDQAMGIAVAGDRIAIGSSSQIWILQSQHPIARRLEPAGRYDGCFVTRLSHVT